MTNVPNLDQHKLRFHRERVEAYLRGERVAPITVDCSLSTACNYKCIYCYGQFQKQAGFEACNLPEPVVMDFIDDCAAVGVKAISIVSDGESTMNPCLADAIVHAHRRGLSVGLATNGYALPMDRLEDMLSALTYLRFNVSGVGPAYNEIHRGPKDAWDRVQKIITQASIFNRLGRHDCTIGLQSVLMTLDPFIESILPLAEFACNRGVDYLVFKHCSDYEGRLGVKYESYATIAQLLLHAEAMSTPTTMITAKWGKMGDGAHRSYSQCYGPPLHLQISGSGLVAPCGMLFADKFKEYHIANLRDVRFLDILQSDRYWDMMDKLASDDFDTSACGTLCLQHRVNEALDKIKKTDSVPWAWREITEDDPHANFL